MNLEKMNRLVKISIPAMIILGIILFALLIFLIQGATKQREMSIELTNLGNEMMHNNDTLIKLMRQYVITQEAQALKAYSDIINNDANLTGKIDKMLEIGLSETEKEYIGHILARLDRLAELEDLALLALDSGQQEQAVAIIFGNEYSGLDKELGQLTNDLIEMKEARTTKEVGRTTMAGTILLVVLFLFFVGTMMVLRHFLKFFDGKMAQFAATSYWYEDILNSLPIPLSITDMDMKTTFINKAVEDMLGVKLSDMREKYCGDVWKAGICNTPRCGIKGLKRGVPSTQFNAGGFDFKVDASYLHDKDHNRIGHIETVQNITDLLNAQREQQKLIEAVREASRVLANDSSIIADGAKHLADGVTKQTATTEELLSAVSDIKQKTINNATIAKDAATMFEEIIIDAEKGNAKMAQMIQAVKEIDESSKQIESVIKVIDSIATQTNLLSLNAAIEAARAGEAGKGFAVVAEEVRDLASKSAEAAKDTGRLIHSTVEKAHLGMEMAAETALSLQEIAKGISQNASNIKDIVKSCEEQTHAIGLLDAGIEEVANIAIETTEIAEKSITTSQDIKEQGSHLEELLS